MIGVVRGWPMPEGIGTSDCELIRDTALAQPVNALTSLAYVVAGAAIIASAVSGRRALAPSVVFGACLAAIGAGSVTFHGPQPEGSQVLHDLPILVTLLYIVVHDVSLLWPGSGRPWALFAATALAATALTNVVTGLGAIAIGIGVVATIALEVVIARRRARGVSARRRRAALPAISATACVAAATWVLGRTGSPACDPDAGFQLHGLWHVISAAVLGLWWWLAVWSVDGGVDRGPMVDGRQGHRPV